MSVRSARWLLFVAVAATAPAPMLGPFDALMPAVGYAMLFAVTAAVAAVEGASGPVPGILQLFGIHVLVYSVLAWLVAWLAARLLAGLSALARLGVVLAACGAMLWLALAFELYRSPFGRAPTANLWGLLS